MAFSSNIAIRIVPMLLLSACSPKVTDDDGGKEPVELLEEGCASFCQRALSCPLGRFAETLEFEDEQTCFTQCLSFHAEVPSDPPEMCILVRADLWSCAGAIENCELFDAFEDNSFGVSNALGSDCSEEMKVFLHKCNG